jgi:hypothetical protein
MQDVEKPDETLQSVSFEKVRLEDDFWLPRLKIQKETLVPFSLEKTQTAVENLQMVGEYLKTGKVQKMHPLARYVASDLYKVMEGAAYLLTLEDDPALEKRMDEIILAVSKKYDISREDILSAKRNKEIAIARHICVYIARTITTLSQAQIGKALNRDRTTVISSEAVIKEEIERNNDFAMEVRELIRSITTGN